MRSDPNSLTMLARTVSILETLAAVASQTRGQWRYAAAARSGGKPKHHSQQEFKMKQVSVGSRVRRVAAAVALAAGCVSTQAAIVSSTIAGSLFLVNSGDPIGTFTFLPPATVGTASVSLDNFDVLFLNTASFFLDGVLLGDLGEGIGQSVTFGLSDTSVLADGAAVLSFVATDYLAGCPCVLPNGDALLEISTDAAPGVPEPPSLALVLGALAAAGLGRRASRRRPAERQSPGTYI